jgi:ribonuclease P/MRP protein subunit RPP40
VFVPGLARLPSDLQSLEPPSYSVSELTLSQLTEPHLQPSLSSLCGLTLDTRVDTDCVYALLPPGKLVLSVDKDTYEQLGLVGRPSRYQKGHRFSEFCGIHLKSTT